jgi:hypothetical protein
LGQEECNTKKALCAKSGSGLLNLKRLSVCEVGVRCFLTESLERAKHDGGGGDGGGGGGEDVVEESFVRESGKPLREKMKEAPGHGSDVRSRKAANRYAKRLKPLTKRQALHEESRMRALSGKPHKSGLISMYMYIRIGALSIRSKFEKKERATSTTTESMHAYFLPCHIQGNPYPELMPRAQACKWR